MTGSTSIDRAIARGMEAAGTITIGDFTVRRVGFGALRVTGPGFFGDPADPEHCVRLLRRVVELGVNFIDTADSYGPHVSEEMIKRALHPYPDDLLIGTKAGYIHPSPGATEAEWFALGRPEFLRMSCETSLRRLGVERIDLFQLHRIDPQVPRDEQFGLLRDLVDEGKVGAVGLSEVTVEELEAAREIVPIAAVQNLYNLSGRQSEDVLDHCEAEGIAFVPWAPIAQGDLLESGGPLDEVARETGATPAQAALAWLLRRSPVMVPIPGTSSIEHLEENCVAAAVPLTEDQFQRLSRLGAP